LTDSLFGEAAADDGQAPIEPAAAGDEVLRLGRHLPERVYLGAASWDFPGWHGWVYEREYAQARLARNGLAAYSRHPVLRAVGVDRGDAQALDAAEWSRTARQVPDGFRFVIKAPSVVTDAVLRAGAGRAASPPAAPNPRFLDAAYAAERFVMPALEALGAKAGPLVLQLAPMPAESMRDSHALIERIAGFVARLPASHAGARPVYAVELRNPELLTPRLVHRLREVGARLCVGVHARMPPASRQAAALRAMDAQGATAGDWVLAGPLVARWSLHAGLGDEQARARYAPFNRLLDADLVTRGALVHLIRVALRSGQDAYVIVDNRAEGCAPASCIELARAVVERSEPA
jgi:uncharacterized protein YecE (DUF72 family)